MVSILAYELIFLAFNSYILLPFFSGYEVKDIWSWSEIMVLASWVFYQGIQLLPISLSEINYSSSSYSMNTGHHIFLFTWSISWNFEPSFAISWLNSLYWLSCYLLIAGIIPNCWPVCIIFRFFEPRTKLVFWRQELVAHIMKGINGIDFSFLNCFQKYLEWSWTEANMYQCWQCMHVNLEGCHQGYR